MKSVKSLFFLMIIAALPVQAAQVKVSCYKNQLMSGSNYLYKASRLGFVQFSYDDQNLDRSGIGQAQVNFYDGARFTHPVEGQIQVASNAILLQFENDRATNLDGKVFGVAANVDIDLNSEGHIDRKHKKAVITYTFNLYNRSEPQVGRYSYFCNL